MGGWSLILVGLGTIVIVLGLAFLLRGRWRDKGKGTSRCQKCWYSMREIASLQCPECGHVATDYRQLLRVRRRTRVRALGLVIMALGGAILLTPGAIEHGVFSVFPTTALLLLEPYFHEDPYQFPEEASYAFGGPTSVISKELARRNAAADLAPWQWRLYFKHGRLLTTRPRWPRGVPLVYKLRSPSWIWPNWTPGSPYTNEWFDMTLMPTGSGRLPTMTARGPRGQSGIKSALAPPDEMGRSWFQATARKGLSGQSEPRAMPLTIAQYLGSVRVALTDTAEQVLRADPDATVGETLKYECRAMLFFRPETHLANPSARFVLRTAAMSLPVHLALGLSVEVRRDGEPIITGRMDDVRERVIFDHAAHVELSRWMYDDYQSDPGLSRWDVVVRGDALASLRALDKDAYWSGEFVVPVRLQP